MKKRVEKYLPRALEVAKKIIANGGDSISKEYNGYISSFGAAIIQSGLIPAVSFYSQQGSAAENRANITNAIYFIAFDNSKIEDIKKKDNQLLEFLIKENENNSNLEFIKSEIIDAAVALKLAVRTFHLTKD